MDEPPIDAPAEVVSKRVFVLLPPTLDADRWRQEFAEGRVPDRSPYGYHHAEKFGYQVVFSIASQSKSSRPSIVSRLLWRIFGFDLLHAWKNRRAIVRSEAQVVWTHTEREFLALLLLRRLRLLRATALIAQSIWLADQWGDLPRVRRAFIRWLLRQAEVCTFLSPANHAFARTQHWNERTQIVDFGISLDSFPIRTPQLRHPLDTIRVLALGNDRHRDWQCLHAAFAGVIRFEVKIASSTFPRRLQCNNISAAVCDQQALKELYEWADVVVVPLLNNLHASGITVVLEATALGKPVVATKAGGLEHYFDDSDLWYVPVGDSADLRAAVLRVAADSQMTACRIQSAQLRLTTRQFTTEGFARRHVELSERLLAMTQPN